MCNEIECKKINGKKIRMPAQINLINEPEVIQYLRDMLNLRPVFGEDYCIKEARRFKDELLETGWSTIELARLERRACYGTRFESILPHIKKRKK